jgi:hypothetical protein
MASMPFLSFGFASQTQEIVDAGIHAGGYFSAMAAARFRHRKRRAASPAATGTPGRPFLLFCKGHSVCFTSIGVNKYRKCLRAAGCIFLLLIQLIPVFPDR